ncbi:hypothetical protein [Circoviridae sp.]|nr:hypothetical protein [Circoviridae sp.]
MRYSNSQFPRTAGIRRAAAHAVIRRSIQRYNMSNRMSVMRNRITQRNSLAWMNAPRRPVLRIRRSPINLR